METIQKYTILLTRIFNSICVAANRRTKFYYVTGGMTYTCTKSIIYIRFSLYFNDLVRGEMIN